MKCAVLILLLKMTPFGICQGQDLASLLGQNLNKDYLLHYWDSSGKYYDRGEYSGIALEVVFKMVEFNAITKKVKVQGITSAGFNSQNHDTIGLCCVHYFIAVPVGENLTKLRPLGVSNDHSLNKWEKEGVFEFEVEISKEDRLYFSNNSGGGLEEFPIGEICYKHVTNR